ncbi:MAG TPA: BTAD domain-containing putative transcriptional regulator [Candidatus Limnocylindrales bacterium]|nr:BTAD domain-containing putative transcriptional regulator [Candidatus Limnocylindrales bacterium]
MLAVAGRLLIRLGSATALLTMLAAVPAGLAVYIGWPLPDHIPSGDELTSFLTSGIGDHTIIDAIAILLWLVWALFTIAVGVEAAAAIRGVQAPRVHALGPLQGLASILVTGLTASVIAGSALIPTTAASIFGPPATATAASTVMPASLDRPVLLTTAGASDAGPQLRTVGTVTLVIDGCGYEHTVVKHESLWRIAELCLGDPRRWPEIWELNKGKYWPHVSGTKKFIDPDVIFPGWVLDLPADAVLPAQTAPLSPPIQTTPPQPPTPSASASPSAQTSPSASPATQPSASPSASTDGGVVGLIPSPPASHHLSASASPTASTQATSSATADAEGTQTPATDEAVHDGVTLPGGWITAGLATGLLAAVAMVWKRRRHRYTPTPIATPVLTDDDLVPPLAASTRIRQALRRANPTTVEVSVAAPTVREYSAAHTKPALPPVGPSGADLAGAGGLLLAAGLGLTGPGAHDAARAMLVAVLSSGTLDDPDAQGRAIIPATTLATLIAVSAVELGPIPRLTIAASMTEAMTILEEEIIRRARILGEQEVTDVAALRASDAYAEPLPQLLLIADTPDPARQRRLATAIGLGETVDIGAVLLGEWPHGTTLSIAGDGATTGGDGRQRLAVLDTDNAAEVLTMLHEAYGDDPGAQPARAVTSTSAPFHTQADDQLDPEPVQDDTGGEPATQIPVVYGARRVQVRVLGTPAVLDFSGQPVHKLRAKSVELLVYLAVNRTGAPLAQIMEALWPDASWRRASERLSTCVANLRRAIRAVLADGHDEPGTESHRIEPVINSGGHYRLDPGIVDIDWWNVLDAYAQVAGSTDDTARLAHLKTAIDAIGGGLADGADYEWADTDRENVRRHHIKIYTYAADLLARDDPHQARVLLDTACQVDPLSEDLARRTMRAAAALGDADAVRHRLRTLRRSLESHGLELNADTEKLANDLVRELTRQHRTDT